MVERGNRGRGKIINLVNKDGLFSISEPHEKLENLVVSEELRGKLKRILKEYRSREKLASFGLSCRRKLLLEGQPGTGKTMTASVLASELCLPLYTVQIDKLITKYLGETSAKLRQIFDSIATNKGVYLFDEFDAVGADRSLDNEVGEMRRILNSFLQFIENDDSQSVIIAATNNRKMLDQALFRRFDDVLHYTLPTVEEVKEIVSLKTGGFDRSFSLDNVVAAELSQLCQAEITRICDDALKEALLSDEPLTADLFRRLCNDRRAIYSKEEAC